MKKKQVTIKKEAFVPCKKDILILKDINSKLDKIVTLHLSIIEKEIQDMRKEMKARPSLVAVFGERMKIMEKDLIACKKALALR